MKNTFKGFTLIELLVVIAIIGILAGLVITSMSGAKTAARDARVKSDIDQTRATAEIYKVNHGNYEGLSGYGDVPKLLNDCNANDDKSTNTCAVHSNATMWCTKAKMQGGDNWCADQTGYVGTTDGCTASTFKCQ